MDNFFAIIFVVPQFGFITSLSWVTLGTHIFYNRASTGDRVPTIVLDSSL